MKWLKVTGVIFGAVVITALGIDAADTLQGSQSTLLGQLVATESGGCPVGMVTVPAATTFTCVDRFEVSPSKDCPHRDPGNERQTAGNLDEEKCVGESKAEAIPWRNLNREQAELVCLRSGKRLPNNEEWKVLAAGTPENGSCNVASGGVRDTGTNNDCQSTLGVFDAVGNVWEWTSDDVFDGVYNNRDLPKEGYVRQADKGGVAAVTGRAPSDSFGSDYFWSESEGVFAMMRGGFYSSREDAGVYATHAATVPTLAVPAIGVRCVK